METTGQKKTTKQENVSEKLEALRYELTLLRLPPDRQSPQYARIFRKRIALQDQRIALLRQLPQPSVRQDA